MHAISLRTVLAALMATCSLAACGDDSPASPEVRWDVDGSPGAGGMALLGDALWVGAPSEEVADRSGDQLLRIDPVDGSVQQHLDMSATVLGEAAGALWVTDVDGLHRVDPRTGEVGAGTGVAYSSIAAVGDRLFGEGDSALFELDPLTGEQLAEVAVPLDPLGTVREVVEAPLAGGDGVLWVQVTEGGDLVMGALDIDTGAFRFTAEVPRRVVATALLADRLWVLSDRSGERTLIAIDAATGAQVVEVALPAGSAPLDEGARSLLVAPDDTLWALDQPAQIVYHLDPADGSVIEQFHFRDRPSEFAVTAEAVIIAAPYDGRLTKVRRSDFGPPPTVG